MTHLKKFEIITAGELMGKHREVGEPIDLTETAGKALAHRVKPHDHRVGALHKDMPQETKLKKITSEKAKRKGNAKK